MRTQCSIPMFHTDVATCDRLSLTSKRGGSLRRLIANDLRELLLAVACPGPNNNVA